VTDGFVLTRNIVLIGPMGVGKTTIGKQLAEHFSLEFKDSDKEIETRTGATISLIFDLEGEEGFRKREQAMIAELSSHAKIVLSTGGGAVLDPENRQNLRTCGYVVYLHASIDQLLERTAFSRNRPLLQTDDKRERIADLMEQRHPLYTAVADTVIDTEQCSIRQVVKKVINNLKQLDISP